MNNDKYLEVAKRYYNNEGAGNGGIWWVEKEAKKR
jgi:hypothetical protein